MIKILYNEKANNGRGLAGAKKAGELYKDSAKEFVDLKNIPGLFEYIETASPEDTIIMTGGDGTVNHLINDIGDRLLTKDVYYYPAGSGNDFWKDIEGDTLSGPVKLNEYLKDLPSVIIDGVKKKFLNGIGYGIDGYCCEKGDEIRRTSTKKVNYTKIALKGLLFDYKPRNARVTVDGIAHEFKHVWLAPIMNGRFYGGGMMVAPGQDRLNPENNLSCVVLYCKSALKALALFPNIFSGKLVNFEKHCTLFTGKNIKVEFDSPCALQIDGDTVLNVTCCEGVSAGC